MMTCCNNSSLMQPYIVSHLRLHRLSILKNGNLKNSGFTIIEILIVILVIGILSSAAVSSYSGAIQDTRIRSAQDRIQTFFQSCKQRAKLRKQEIKIIYNEKAQCLANSDSVTSILKVPELYSKSVPNLIEIDKNGKFKIKNHEVSSLNLLLDSPNGKLATITISL